MKILIIFVLFMDSLTILMGATVFPASTNGNNVFTGTNTFTKTIIGNASTATSAAQLAGIPPPFVSAVPITNSTFFIFDGDSLTAGSGGSLGLAYPYWMSNLYSTANIVLYTNFSVGGSTSSNVWARYATSVSPFKPNGVTNAWFFCWAGVNDVYNGWVATNTIGYLSNIWYAAKADGFKVVAFTISDRNDFSPRYTRQPVRLVVNNYIRTSDLPDVVVDIAQMFPFADTNLQSDGVHFSTNCQRIIAQNVWKAIHMTQPVYPSVNVVATNVESYGTIYSLGAAQFGSVTCDNTMTAAGGAYGISTTGIWGLSAGYGAITADLMTLSPKHGTRWTFNGGTSGFTNGSLVFKVDGTNICAMTNDWVRNLIAFNADVSVSGTLTATNGVVLPQLPWIPTNSIPASSTGWTNYVLCNLSNTVAGTVGGPCYVATNHSAAGSFVIVKPTLTQTTWP